MLISFEVNLPDEFVDEQRGPEKLAGLARESLLMQLLRTGTISQGKVAELLGVDRWTLVDIMNAHDVPFFNVTELDLGDMVEELRLLRKADEG